MSRLASGITHCGQRRRHRLVAPIRLDVVPPEDGLAALLPIARVENGPERFGRRRHRIARAAARSRRCGLTDHVGSLGDAEPGSDERVEPPPLLPQQAEQAERADVTIRDEEPVEPERRLAGLESPRAHDSELAGDASVQRPGLPDVDERAGVARKVLRQLRQHAERVVGPQDVLGRADADVCDVSL